MDWEEPEREPPPEAPYLDGVRKDGFNTPKFGRSEAAGMTYELGSYEVLWQPEDYLFPQSPVTVSTAESPVFCLANMEVDVEA